MRHSQLEALNTVALSDKTLPLLELIQHNPTGRTLSTPTPFENIFKKNLKNIKFPLMVDIPMYINLSVTKLKKNIRDFLNPIYLNQNLRIDHYNLLSGISSIIPVISYKPTTPYIPNFITYQENNLRTNFPILAFRVFCNSNIYSILTEISSIIKNTDYLILDLESNDYKDSSITPLYATIENYKKKLGFKSIILHTPIPNSVSNTSITNSVKVPGTDNSLLKQFSTSFKFDAIGDYAGIKKDDLVEGFMGYIATIFYKYSTNDYIGYTANPSKNPNTYKTVIAPDIIGSHCWSSYSSNHHKNCKGCTHIDQINSGLTTSGSRTTWKTICIQHYIYTMEEFLT